MSGVVCTCFELFSSREMPTEGASPPVSPFMKTLEGLMLSPGNNLDPDWQQRAEDELNETPENYKQKTNALRDLIKSTY